MNTIPETPRITGLAETPVSRTPTQTVIDQSLQAQKYNPQQKQTTFSMTSTFEDFQAQLTNVLLKQGFAHEQAALILKSGVMRLEEFSRSLLLSHALMGNKQLFEQFTKNLKLIQLREQNNEQGIKVYLDVLDHLLNTDTQKMVEEGFAGLHLSASDRKGKGYPAGRTEERFPLPLKEISELMEKSVRHLPRNLSAQQLKQVKDTMDFAALSAEEFPQRFAPDLYAYSELGRRAITLEQYLKLSSEIPPLRLVNLLHVVEKNGQHSQGVLQVFLSAFDRGESLLDVLEQMEIRYGIPVFDKTSLSNQVGTARVLDMDSLPLTMMQGEDVVIEFLGMDRLDGLVAADRAGFVLLPQQQEILGHSINLSFLPVGVYFLVAATMNTQQKMMTLWKKVIVQGRLKRDQEQDSGQQDGSDSGQDGLQDKNDKQDIADRSFRPLSQMRPDSTPVHMDFTGSKVRQKGLFVGEVVLPVSDFSDVKAPGVVRMTNSGLFISHAEYQSGIFPHHAVMFRFLAGEMISTDLRRRHEILKLAYSRPFENLDSAIKDFILAPAEQLKPFLKKLEAFFAELLNLFPAGERTFDVARGLMTREAEAFAGGVPHAEMYENMSREERRREFVSACYSKGAFAMASAGHVSGALKGLTFASLVNWEDENQKAILGEYLENIRNVHFARASLDAVQNHYDTHLRHSSGERLLASPVYREKGEQFVHAFDLPPVDLPV